MENITRESYIEAEREKRKAVYKAERETRLDLLSHIISNDYIDAYNMRDIIETYNIEAQELKEYCLSFDFLDDENTRNYFTELYYEMGLLCQECENELDEEELCSNTECDSCDDSYLSEEQLEERYNES